MADLLTDLREIFANEYRVDRELTAGGMSRVFLATDHALGRQVVIKILPPELTSEMSTARFKRESGLTAHLQHPHILPVIAAGSRSRSSRACRSPACPWPPPHTAQETGP